MMAAAPIVLLVMGYDEVVAQTGGLFDVKLLLPFGISLLGLIMPISSSSISMEGKNWWIMQSLPLSNETIFKSKILCNLIIIAPFYLVAVVVSIIAVPFQLSELFGMLVIPAVYLLYSAVIGLRINLAFPVMEWDNEARVVKQGAASMISMLSGIAAILPPIVIYFMFPQISRNLLQWGTVITVLAVTYFFYRQSLKKSIVL